MPRAKFLLKLFSKSLRFPKAEPWSLVATSEILSALFFLLSFFFCALCVKRKSVVGREIYLNKERVAESLAYKNIIAFCADDRWSPLQDYARFNILIVGTGVPDGPKIKTIKV